MMTLILSPDMVKGDEAVLAWHRSQGIDPHDTYKIIVNTDTMTATIFQYHRNVKGQFYIDPMNIDEVAKKEPWTQPITALPPGGFKTFNDGCLVRHGQ